MSARAAAVLLLVVAACGGSGSSAEPPPAGPNLIVITMDTLRSDHLGCYGYHRDTSPALDAVAARSLVFERCYAPIPRTAPSHTSLFTGVYPYEHGITQNIGRRLVDEIVAGDVAAPESSLRTLPEWMKARGYATGGFVSATPVKRATGIASGFDAWSEPTDHRRSAEAVNADLVPWLEQVSEPFFLWGHYFDPHGPFDDTLPVPEAYVQRYETDAGLERHLAERGFPAAVTNKHYDGVPPERLLNVYDGCIRYLDDQLARVFEVLDRRGLWENTVVVLTSDHGEGLGQHGYAGHGIVWNEQLRVPLIVWAPGTDARRVEDAVSLIDVIPTVMGLAPELALAPFLERARGVDASRVPAREARREQFSMSSLGQGEFSLVSDGWKYLLREKGDDQLFDLTRDPHELDDRRAAEPERAAELRRRLLDLIAEQREVGRRYAAGVGVTEDEGTLDDLNRLGYGGEDE